MTRRDAQSLRPGYRPALTTHRDGPGRYQITVGTGVNTKTWHVWRSRRGRWYGECNSVPGKMVDAPTLRVAKFDAQFGCFVDCASAGLEEQER